MNLESFTEELTALYKDIGTGKVEAAMAHELNNTAANIQGAIRLGLLNAKLQNKSPDLAFFRSARKAAVKKAVKRG